MRDRAIELRGIVKRYGATVANDSVDLDVRPGGRCHVEMLSDDGSTR